MRNKPGPTKALRPELPKMITLPARFVTICAGATGVFGGAGGGAKLGALKQVGEYPLQIALHTDVVVTITVAVIGEA